MSRPFALEGALIELHAAKFLIGSKHHTMEQHVTFLPRVPKSPLNKEKDDDEEGSRNDPVTMGGFISLQL